MASRKPSARARKIAAFKEERASSIDDIFGREEQRRRERAAQHEAALREKSCLSKNRYATRGEAEAAILSCAEHAARSALLPLRLLRRLAPDI